MEHSGVAFGTSGARGLVSAMTDAVCCAYTLGFLQHLQSVGEFKAGTSVAVAGDLRPSTPRILTACVAAIEAAGGIPVFCGYVPTPALCHFAFARSIPSLMVTGSHIPDDRNGIKFNRARGEFLKSDEAAMRNEIITLPSGWFNAEGALVHPVTLPPIIPVIPDFIKRYKDFFGENALSGFRLGIYQHSAVGRDALVQIVEALGAETIVLGRSEQFVSVDTEAVRPEDISLAQEWAKTENFDALLTTDGDSDRPLLADHTGTWLRGDVLGILAAQFLAARSVATPVSSNTALEKTGSIESIRRTRIGSPYVVTAMTEAAESGIVPSVGYEANGGFLLASDIIKGGNRLAALPTRDSVLPMLCALAACKHHGNKLSRLVATLPPRFTLSDRLQNMPTAQSLAKLEGLGANPEQEVEKLGFVAACGPLMALDETDGVRMTFASQEVIHLRPSGNAPELRVYVEADSTARAEALLALGMQAVALWRKE
ncbi:MAG: phosphomannomutase [Acetobacter cibinongensis]